MESGRIAGQSVAGALSARATSDPEGVCLVLDDDHVTCGQWEIRAKALAASLAGLGIESGDRVAVVMPSWPEFVISMLAVAKLGVVLVPLTHGSRDRTSSTRCDTPRPWLPSRRRRWAM